MNTILQNEYNVCDVNVEDDEEEENSDNLGGSCSFLPTILMTVMRPATKNMTLVMTMMLMMLMMVMMVITKILRSIGLARKGKDFSALKYDTLFSRNNRH